jgi:hypothetical protein
MLEKFDKGKCSSLSSHYIVDEEKKVFNNENWFRGLGWHTGRPSKTDTQTASAPTRSSLLSGGHLSMFQKTLSDSLEVLVTYSKLMFLVLNQVYY